MGHAAVKAAVGAAVQRAAAQGVKPAAGARGADAGAQPLVVTRVRARGSEDPTFKVIKPGGQNARHSAFHFGCVRFLFFTVLCRELFVCCFFRVILFVPCSRNRVLTSSHGFLLVLSISIWVEVA